LRRSLEGKIHRIGSPRNVAGLTVIFWLLQNRRSEAAPGGLAQAVAKSVTIPGVSSSMAELMVHGVVSSLARARHKLLAMVLLLILGRLMLIPIGILRGRAQRNEVAIAPAPTAAPKVLLSTGSSELAAASAPADEKPWFDPNAPAPLSRPYAPADDVPETPQK